MFFFYRLTYFSYGRGKSIIFSYVSSKVSTFDFKMVTYNFIILIYSNHGRDYLFECLTIYISNIGQSVNEINNVFLSCYYSDVVTRLTLTYCAIKIKK